jgi:hypothetical protein
MPNFIFNIILSCLFRNFQSTYGKSQIVWKTAGNQQMLVAFYALCANFQTGMCRGNYSKPFDKESRIKYIVDMTREFC